MRAGGEYFLEPAGAVQRRYEALRCYFVEDASAESVGARFGYSPATVHQLAAELRAGRSSFSRSSKPGPKGPRKTHTIRDRVLVLRAADRSVTEIAQALTAQGDAVSAQTVWAMKFHRLGPRTVGIHQPADQTTYPPARQSKISTSAIGCVDHPRPRGTPASPTLSKARQPGSPLPRNLPRFAPRRPDRQRYLAGFWQRYVAEPAASGGESGQEAGALDRAVAGGAGDLEQLGQVEGGVRAIAPELHEQGLLLGAELGLLATQPAVGLATAIPSRVPDCSGLASIMWTGQPAQVCSASGSQQRMAPGWAWREPFRDCHFGSAARRRL